MAARKRELKWRYDETAHVYDRRYEQIQQRKYEVALSKISHANTIMDIGCGTGMLLDELVKRSKFTVGIDMSVEMLRIARQRSSGASLLCADADHLPLKDGSIEVAISVTMLQNIPDPAVAMRELVRAVKLGGTVIVTTLFHKHDTKLLAMWVNAVGLKSAIIEEIPESEDIICVAKRIS